MEAEEGEEDDDGTVARQKCATTRTYSMHSNDLMIDMIGCELTCWKGGDSKPNVVIHHTIAMRLDLDHFSFGFVNPVTRRHDL